MNVNKYVSPPDPDFPLLTDSVGNPDVAEALAEQSEAQRKQRVADVKRALNTVQAGARTYQSQIRDLVQERKRIEKNLAQAGKRRDQNRIALALLLTDAEVTSAQRFGLYAMLHQYCSISTADVLAAYDVKPVPNVDDRETIAEKAAELLPDGFLDSLRKQGI